MTFVYPIMIRIPDNVQHSGRLVRVVVIRVAGTCKIIHALWAAACRDDGNELAGISGRTRDYNIVINSRARAFSRETALARHGTSPGSRTLPQQRIRMEPFVVLSSPVRDHPFVIIRS